MEIRMETDEYSEGICIFMRTSFAFVLAFFSSLLRCVLCVLCTCTGINVDVEREDSRSVSHKKRKIGKVSIFEQSVDA